MAMKLLFQNARIVDIQSPYHNQVVDVLVDDEQIIAIGENIEFDGSIINLEGASMFTGFAELHSDLGEPGNEESETLATGSAAAAAGGFTAVGVVSNGAPHIQDKTGIEFLLSKGESLPVQIVPLGVMSRGSKGEELSDMYDMNLAGSPMFGDYKHGVSNANLLKLALLYSKPFGRIFVHPEDSNLSAKGMMHEGIMSTYVGLKGIPEISEVVQVARDLKLVEYTEGALHIASVSSAGSIDLIRAAKKQGLNVTCSVNIHHLLFTDEDLENYDTNLKTNPPLQSKDNQAALIEAVKDGTIDCLAVDHLPKDIEQKQCEFDNAEFGMAGFEGSVASLLDRINIDSEKIQELLSTNPRKLLGLPELKIIEGSIAEFTIIGNNGQNWTGFASKSFNNPFKGEQTNTSIIGVYTKGAWLSL
jgi:dihydroorotase